MRYREVKKGMEVVVYRMFDSQWKKTKRPKCGKKQIHNEKYFIPFSLIGIKGKVIQVLTPSSPFPVVVNIRGRDILFSHKELMKG